MEDESEEDYNKRLEEWYCETGNVTYLVKAPDKNAGSTYIASNFEVEPTLIQIAPTVNGNNCGVSDSLSYIPEC